MRELATSATTLDVKLGGKSAMRTPQGPSALLRGRVRNQALNVANHNNPRTMGATTWIRTHNLRMIHGHAGKHAETGIAAWAIHLSIKARTNVGSKAGWAIWSPTMGQCGAVVATVRLRLPHQETAVNRKRAGTTMVQTITNFMRAKEVHRIVKPDAKRINSVKVGRSFPTASVTTRQTSAISNHR